MSNPSTPLKQKPATMLLYSAFRKRHCVSFTMRPTGNTISTLISLCKSVTIESCTAGTASSKRVKTFVRRTCQSAMYTLNSAKVQVFCFTETNGAPFGDVWMQSFCHTPATSCISFGSQSPPNAVWKMSHLKLFRPRRSAFRSIRSLADSQAAQTGSPSAGQTWATPVPGCRLQVTLPTPAQELAGGVGSNGPEVKPAMRAVRLVSPTTVAPPKIASLHARDEPMAACMMPPDEPRGSCCRPV
mmetsp:Transcript_113007/g.364874  ORF Transcript_113007/g.364874 Transcript_113007/m.364874 type:complete len:243 (+) Transcript_113007:270-998(+)